MINIVIGEPKKLSNNVLVKQSAFVSFDYDGEIVNFIKNMGTRVYNPDNHTWEMPVQNIVSLCNKFTNKEIKISGIYKSLAEKVDSEIPSTYKFKTKPFNHQIDGVKFGLSRGKFLLCDDQGLGKTKQIIDWAGCLAEQGVSGKILIICGVNSLKYNWLSEVSKHSDDKGYVIGTRYRKNGNMYEGSLKDKLADFDNLPDCKYIITNIETIRGGAEKVSKTKYIFPVAEKIQKLCDSGVISAIALDECHKCFEYNTIIDTDLGELKIGDIVTKQLACRVKSYNEETGEFEYKPVVDYFKNDTSECAFMELTFDVDGEEKTIKCTDDHLFYTKNRGWVMAKDLTDEDDFDLTDF